MSDTHDDTLVNGLKRILSGMVVLGSKIRFFTWSLLLGQLHDVRRLVRADHQFVESLSDDIATRIQANGGTLSGPFSQFSRTSSIREVMGESATNPLVQLALDHDQMVSDTQFVVLMLQETPDAETAHLMFHSVEAHQEWSQSLRALAKNNETLRLV